MAKCRLLGYLTLSLRAVVGLTLGSGQSSFSRHSRHVGAACTAQIGDFWRSWKHRDFEVLFTTVAIGTRSQVLG